MIEGKLNQNCRIKIKDKENCLKRNFLTAKIGRIIITKELN